MTMSLLRRLIREVLSDEEGTFTSARLVHEYQIVHGGSRMFVTSRAKEPNWLDVASGNKSKVEATFDLQGEEVYLNRMDAFSAGMGFGRETMSATLAFLSSRGFKRARGYIEHGNFDSQNMMRKLGAVVEKDEKHGSYWTIDIIGRAV